eukprot:3712924-Pyramimonas_sp.AAC.1
MPCHRRYGPLRLRLPTTSTLIGLTAEAFAEEAPATAATSSVTTPVPSKSPPGSSPGSLARNSAPTSTVLLETPTVPLGRRGDPLVSRTTSAPPVFWNQEKVWLARRPRGGSQLARATPPTVTVSR